MFMYMLIFFLVFFLYFFLIWMFTTTPYTLFSFISSWYSQEEPEHTENTVCVRMHIMCGVFQDRMRCDDSAPHRKYHEHRATEPHEGKREGTRKKNGKIIIINTYGSSHQTLSFFSSHHNFPVLPHPNPHPMPIHTMHGSRFLAFTPFNSDAHNVLYFHPLLWPFLLPLFA